MQSRDIKMLKIVKSFAGPAALWLATSMAGLAITNSAMANEPNNQAASKAEISEVSAIELAYKKEFAFLEAQKRYLQTRLTRLLEGSNKEFDSEKSKISLLETQVIARSQSVDLQKNLLLDAERVVQANEDNQEVFNSTFMQADASLETYTKSLQSDKKFQDLSDGQKVTELFDRAVNLLSSLSSVRTEQGDCP